MNLKEDSQKLLTFIERDQSITEETAKKAEVKTNERKKIEADIKALDAEINFHKGEMEKNKDMLN